MIDSSGRGGGEDLEWNAEDWKWAALQSQSFNQNELDETRRKKNKYCDIGCVIGSKKAKKWRLFSIVIAFCVIGLPMIEAKRHGRSPPPDQYSDALHKTLLFFDAQKCKFFIFNFVEHFPIK